MEKAVVKVLLDPNQRAWAHAEARRRSCSVSQVIRDVVVDAMARQAATAGK